MLQQSKNIDDRFVYTDKRRRYVSFPLGGIGTGSVSLTGSGRLIDWSIRNRPAIDQFNGYSHFAIKAEQDGKLLDARVLNGPYEGTPTGSPSARKFDGFGFGANRDSMAGVPHFDDVTFIGRFPVAELEFHHASFPGQVRHDGVQPLHPAQRPRLVDAGRALRHSRSKTTPPRRSTTRSPRPSATTAATAASTPLRRKTNSASFTSPRPTREIRNNAAILQSSPTGTMSSTSTTIFAVSGSTVSVSTGENSRGQAASANGATTNRARPRTCSSSPSTARLRCALRVAPGETRQVRFAISWNYPLGSIYWFNRDQPGSPPFEGTPPTWKNYYATQWADSTASGADAFKRWDALEAQTVAFRDSIFGSSLPPEIIDAVNGTLGILRSATLIRLEGGEIWGWEGQHIHEGSCEGSCTHVWNYQQALANLFPALERTLRETEFTYNQLPSGGLTFRQRLPLGSGFDIIGPCADGHFGAIVKAYREWKNLGDDAWLQRYWPNIRTRDRIRLVAG